MILTFLGTAAANAYPEAFCRCANCERARQLGGPSLRKRSSALIDDELLIDLGPDIMTAASQHSRPLTRVRFCLQTHAHADHLDPSHFLSRSPAYGVVGAPRLHFYASPVTLRLAAQLLERDCAPASFLDPEVGERLNLQLHPVEPGQSFIVGRYRVTAFPASHDPGVAPLLYAIQADGRCIFYGTDTASLAEKTWRAFHRQKLQFNLVILDHTYGPQQSGSDHLNAWQLIEHARRMREEGLLAENGRVFATHIAHEGNPAYPELAEFAAGHGYEIAYDGLSL
ncbi:MAG TPA: MBL fold metallo-hydrolase [Anaerolineales bacterium]|nr:MBL fold metallo-hydrolase [Anaerolineales bacterium]